MDQPANPAATPVQADKGAIQQPPVQLRLGRLALAVLCLVLVGLIAGFLPRIRAHRVLLHEMKDLALPSVSVIHPAAGKSGANVSLPAEIKAFVEAPIYARASGYIKTWTADMGDSVKEGQILAEIDTPELDQELARSRAELAQADAALELARTTAARWADLLKTSSVSEQEAAEKKADLALKTATREAARSNVRRLEQMKSFAHITAPFAGTITARKTDVGQLISADNGKELFRLAQTQTLRVFVHVPQTLARAIESGQQAELAFAELPGRTFEAKVVRTAGAMDPESRTLLTELHVDNARGEILAGSFAQVRFIEAHPEAALTIPANALLFRAAGLQVGVVAPNDKIELRPVKLGRDFGHSVEVMAGLEATDRVVLNPPDSLNGGETVRVAETVPAADRK